MTNRLNERIEDMSIDELKASLDRLVEASRTDTSYNSQIQQHRENEIVRLTGELYRRKRQQD